MGHYIEAYYSEYEVCDECDTVNIITCDMGLEEGDEVPYTESLEAMTWHEETDRILCDNCLDEMREEGSEVDASYKVEMAEQFIANL